MHSNNVGLKALVFLTTIAGPANAFFRIPCGGSVVLERADPIVDPGEVSGHVHTISGGNGFGFSMDYEQARSANCSSCPVKADLSNYWTPKLYFHNADDKYEDVPQAGSSDNNNGGMTVYYLQRGPGEIKAFPPGFRMVAGNPFQRSFTDAEAAPGRAVNYNCLSSGQDETHKMPDYNCPGGLRAQIFFPSCWDGKHNDTEDHQSHMAYPIGKHDNGACPPSHPKQLVSIFFEVLYDTNHFADRWPEAGKNPFVFAQGDKTGYGFHGDFVNGWDQDVLQKAIDTCTDDSGVLEACEMFDPGEDGVDVETSPLWNSTRQHGCRIPPSVDEEVTGVLTQLPGCNTPSGNGSNATPESCPFTPIGQPKTFFTDFTKMLDYSYEGCGSDDYYDRTFTGAHTSSDNMTTKYCVEYCKSKGYSLAGLEYARECYCDNDYSDPSRAPQPGIMGNCGTPCSGDETDYCGGTSALSVYKSCGGGKCSNVVYGVVGNASATSNGSDGDKKKRHLGQHRHARLHHES